MRAHTLMSTVLATVTLTAQQRISLARPEGGGSPVERAIHDLAQPARHAPAMAQLFAVGEPAVGPLVGVVARGGADTPFALQVLGALAGDARAAVPQLRRLTAAGGHPFAAAIELTIAAIGERDSVLVADFSADVVIEFAPDGKELRRVGHAGIWGVQPLADDRLLVTSANGHIAEIDWQGHEFWRLDTPGSPLTARRLLDGRTVVACWRGSCVLVLDAARQQIARVEGLDAADVEPGWDGNLWITSYSDQRLVELAPDGRILSSQKLAATPMDVDLLPNGNRLLAFDRARKLIEFDPAGVEAASSVVEQEPEAVHRLRDGRLAIAWATGAQLRDADGKVLFRYDSGQCSEVIARLQPARATGRENRDQR